MTQVETQFQTFYEGPTIGWHNAVIQRAQLNSGEPGLIGPNEELTYKQLLWRAEKWAAQLQSDGIEPDDIVMVRMPKEYEFVATIALSMLGATAVSNTAKQYYDFEAETDWLLTRIPAENYPEAKQIVMSPLWIQRSYNNSEAFSPVGLKTSDSIASICLTSGTTGRPKAVAISHRELMLRIATWQNVFPGNGNEYHLTDMGPVGGGVRPKLLVGAGRPVFHFGVKKDPRDIVELSQRHPPTQISGSTIQVQQFLRFFERSPLNFSQVDAVRAGGSTVPVALQEHVRNRFGFELSMGYGSTEAGIISWRMGDPSLPAQNVGHLVDSAELQIVDSNHHPVALGEFGKVRVKTLEMAHEYRNDPDATSKHFRDGWFYSGDTGALQPDGSLLLGGRESEIINLGGVKVDPTLIDEIALNTLNATDAAAFGYQDRDGREHLGVAVVAAASSAANNKLKTRDFEKAISRKYPIKGDIYYLTLAELPRNVMGKVERKRLAELASSRL